MQEVRLVDRGGGAEGVGAVFQTRGVRRWKVGGEGGAVFETGGRSLRRVKPRCNEIRRDETKQVEIR